MFGTTASRLAPRRERRASFTLVELLFVMAIIAILASLTLYAGSFLLKSGQRSRAKSEVQAMSTALEGYKTDNGIFPQDSTLTTNTYASVNVTTTGAGSYQVPAATLYQALSGQTNYNDVPLSAGKSYMSFKANQLGNVSAPAGTTAAGSTTYVQDPFGYPYGYSTGTASGSLMTNYPYNGSGFFDLWSTAGTTGGSSGTQTNSAAWIVNW